MIYLVIGLFFISFILLLKIAEQQIKLNSFNKVEALLGSDETIHLIEDSNKHINIIVDSLSLIDNPEFSINKKSNHLSQLVNLIQLYREKIENLRNLKTRYDYASQTGMTDAVPAYSIFPYDVHSINKFVEAGVLDSITYYVRHYYDSSYETRYKLNNNKYEEEIRKYNLLILNSTQEAFSDKKTIELISSILIKESSLSKLRKNKLSLDSKKESIDYFYKLNKTSRCFLLENHG